MKTEFRNNIRIIGLLSKNSGTLDFQSKCTSTLLYSFNFNQSKSFLRLQNTIKNRTKLRKVVYFKCTIFLIRRTCFLFPNGFFDVFFVPKSLIVVTWSRLIRLIPIWKCYLRLLQKLLVLIYILSFPLKSG